MKAKIETTTKTTTTTSQTSSTIESKIHTYHDAEVQALSHIF